MTARHRAPLAGAPFVRPQARRDQPLRIQPGRFLLALLVLGALVGGACGPARPELERFHTDDRVDPLRFPDVPAVVLLDRTELKFTFSPNKGRPYAEQIKTRRIQVLKPEALDLARVRIPVDGRSAIFHVQARRTAPNGDTEEMPADRALDLMRFKSGSPPAKLYQGPAAKVTKVSNVQVGDVLEVSWVRVFTDPRWVDPIRVSGDLPVVRGEVIIDHPRQFDVDYRVTKLGQVVQVRPNKIPVMVKGVEEGGEGVPGNRLAFLFENEKAIYPEDLRPSVEALATQVHVQLKGYDVGGTRRTAYSSWDDVAAWYRELVAGNDRPSGSVSSAVQTAGGKEGKKREKLRRVQRFVQDEIADVPTFLHLSALKTQDPAKVLAVKMGDSKDQASLALAMLREMGVDGFPVLVSRFGSFAAVPDLPTPAPFNHVVVAVPQGGRYGFIDPATRGLPTGRLPGLLQGQRGLLIRPDGAELIDLPVDVTQANRSTLTYDLALARDGTTSGQLIVSLDGLDAARARTVLAQGGDLPQKLKEVITPGDASKLRWAEALVINREKAGDPDRTLKLQIVIAPTLLGRVKPSGALELPLEEVVGRPLPWLWREARYMPLVFGFKRQETTKVTLSFPPKMGVELVPLGQEEKSELVNIKDEFAVADGELYLKRQLILDTRAVEPARYSEIKLPVRAIWASQAEPLRIVEGGERGSAYGTDPF